MTRDLAPALRALAPLLAVLALAGGCKERPADPVLPGDSRTDQRAPLLPLPLPFAWPF